MKFNINEYFQNQHESLQWCLTLTCVSIAISSLEYIVIRKNFKKEGIFSWHILSSRSFYQRKLKRYNFLFEYNATMIIQTLKLSCCILLPFVKNHHIIITLTTLLLISSLIFFYRNFLGNDGSDQMNHIIIVALLFAFLFNENISTNICLVFIAMQSIISYVIAGIAKIVSKKWRTGEAIVQIMNTRTYGHFKLSSLLNRLSKRTTFLLSWQIMITETVFFMVLFFPAPWFFIFLIWGIIFHIYNAAVMGLNNFFWTFLATYPCIIYTHGLIIK